MSEEPKHYVWLKGERWDASANGYANNLKVPQHAICSKSLFVDMVSCIKKDCECWHKYRADKARAVAEVAE